MLRSAELRAKCHETRLRSVQQRHHGLGDPLERASGRCPKRHDGRLIEHDSRLDRQVGHSFWRRLENARVGSASARTRSTSIEPGKDRRTAMGPAARTPRAAARRALKIKVRPSAAAMCAASVASSTASSARMVAARSPASIRQGKPPRRYRSAAATPMKSRNPGSSVSKIESSCEVICRKSRRPGHALAVCYIARRLPERSTFSGLPQST